MAEFLGYIITESPRAWYFWDHFWSQPDWMPKSQTTLIRDETTLEVKLITSPWLDGKNNLEEFTFREVVPFNG